MKKALLAAFPYAVFLLLLAVSWGRWIEPYVDSGRELMVPWRLAQGEALYSQIHFHHGPLAPYLGAAVDRIAGRCLAARVVLAACLAIFQLEALRRLTLRLLPPSHASLASGLAVAVAMFLRPGGWLFPFSFDTAIAVASLTAALWLAESRRGDALAALCLLAALLSRLELGLAGVLALAWEARRQPRRWMTLTAAPAAGAAAAYVALSLGIPPEKLVRDGWLALLRPPLAFRNVYRAYAGLDRPGLRLAELALAVVLLLLLLALLAAGSAIVAKSRSGRAAAAAQVVVLGVLLLAGAICLGPPARATETLRLLPPLVRVVPPVILGAAAMRLGARLAGRRASFSALSDATMLIAALFAARLLLAAGYVGPYDAFFLPLPLTVTLALVFRGADKASRWLGPALPKLVAASLAVFLLFRVASEIQDYRARVWSPVPTPAGRVFLAEPVATTTRLALTDLAGRLPAGATLVGFPEVGFFNYVLGLKNPLPLEQFFPGHVETAADEERIIRSLAENPPDAVLLCNVLAIGENRPSFGVDYLARLDRFVRERFVAVASFGPGAGLDARVGEGGFFVTVRVPRRSRASP